MKEDREKETNVFNRKLEQSTFVIKELMFSYHYECKLVYRGSITN